MALSKHMVVLSLYEMWCPKAEVAWDVEQTHTFRVQNMTFCALVCLLLTQFPWVVRGDTDVNYVLIAGSSRDENNLEQVHISDTDTSAVHGVGVDSRKQRMYAAHHFQFESTYGMLHPWPRRPALTISSTTYIHEHREL